MSHLKPPALALLFTLLMGVPLPTLAKEPPKSLPVNPEKTEPVPAESQPPAEAQNKKLDAGNPQDNKQQLPQGQSSEKSHQELSASRRFLKIFDTAPQKNQKSTLLSADKIAITKPDGWVQKSSKNPYIVLQIVEAGRPQNCIEIRKAGHEIPDSRLASYLSSFTAMFERAGFESVQQDFPGLKKIITSKASSPKYLIGGLKGDYLKYAVSKNSPLKLSKEEVGLLLFLYKDKNEAWIFVAYSTIKEIDDIQPVFENVVKSSQFDF